MGVQSFASGLVMADQSAKRHLEYGRWLVAHHRVSDDLERVDTLEPAPTTCLHCGVGLLGAEAILCTVCTLALEAGQW